MIHEGIKYYVAGAGYYMDSKGNYLHHRILPRKEGYVIDHINGNRLDNHPDNLRYVTTFQNTMNKKAQNNIGIKNVYFDRKRNLGKPYRVLFHINGKNYCFGRHGDIDFAESLAGDINRQFLEA